MWDPDIEEFWKNYNLMVKYKPETYIFIVENPLPLELPVILFYILFFPLSLY